MAMTPEARVKRAIRNTLDSMGAYYTMPIGSGYGNSGTPDFLCCVAGRFLAIEAKAGKGKPTALQEAAMTRIREAGGYAIVVNEHNLDDVGVYVLLCEHK